MMIFIVKIKPLNSKLLNGLEIFNEATLMSTSYLLAGFTDYAPMLKTNATQKDIDKSLSDE
jgi:hypothetical protein